MVEYRKKKNEKITLNKGGQKTCAASDEQLILLVCPYDIFCIRNFHYCCFIVHKHENEYELKWRK